MEEAIEILDSSLLEIESIKEYLRQFKEYEILNKKIEHDHGEINVLCGDDLIRLMFLDICDGKWWSICRYHADETKYEQIDSITKENGYNRVILYSGHMEDSCHSYIVWSSYKYLNNQLVHGRKQTRVVPIKDVKKIQYSKNMNLTELIGLIDEKSNNIIEKDDLNDVKTMVLKLEKYN